MTDPSTAPPPSTAPLPLTVVPGHPGALTIASAGATGHPAGAALRGRLRLIPSVPADTTPPAEAITGPNGAAACAATGEDGSLVAEYGLLAVVAATIAGVLITWARGGALAGFFDALLSSARGLVGA